MRIGLALLMLTLAGCVSSPPTAEPTSALSAPALASSPTPVILSSEQLYQDDPRFIGQSNPRFAQFPVDAALPPVQSGDGQVEVVLEDGAVLPGEIFQFPDSRQPGILMLGGVSTSWGALPLKLAQAGFAVLVVESGAMPQTRQVETMFQSLIAVATVDPGNIGIIGAAQTADTAMLACAVNALCDAAALLSPLSRDTLLNMIGSYGERPLWLAASREDGESHAAALALAQAARAEVELVEAETGRGASLLQSRPELVNQLVDWFAAHLGSTSNE